MTRMYSTISLVLLQHRLPFLSTMDVDHSQHATIDPESGRLCTEIFFEMRGGLVGVYHRRMSEGAFSFRAAR
jgi:hypothetical protein